MTTAGVVLLKASADIAARALSVVTFPIVAAYTGAAGYGAYGQVHTIVGFIVPLASLGLGAAMVRHFSARAWTAMTARHVARTGAIVLGLSFLPTLLMAVFAGWLNDTFLGSPIGAELFAWGSPLVALGAAEVWLLDLLRSRNWLVQYSLIQLGQTALLVAATVALLPAGFGIVGLIQAAVIIKALSLAAALISALRSSELEEMSESEPAPPRVGAMMRYGLPLTIAGLGGWMVNLSDRLVIGHFATPEELGRYGAAYTLAGMMVLASSPLMLPVYRRYMKATADGDLSRIVDDTRLFHRYLSLALIPTAVYLAIMSGPIIVMLGGDEFRSSSLVAVLVIAGLFVDQWNGLAHYLLACRDRTIFLQNAWLGCGTLNLVLCIVLVPSFGIEGAAGATLASFLVLESCVFVAANRALPLVRMYRWDSSLRAGAAAALAGGAALAVNAQSGQGAGGVTLATVAFAGVFAVAIALVRGVHRADLQVVLRATGLRREPQMAP